MIAVFVAAFLWPPNPVRRVREGIARRRRQIRDDLVRACELVDAHDRAREAAAHLARVRRGVEDADEGIAEISAAYEALRWNPWHGRRRAELDALEGDARLLARLSLHVRSMVRYISDSIGRSEAEPPGWAAVKGSLLEAALAICDAIDRTLGDDDAGPCLERARRARHAFAERTAGDALAGAIAIELGHLIADLSTGAPEPEPSPTWWRRALSAFGRGRVA